MPICHLYYIQKATLRTVYFPHVEILIFLFSFLLIFFYVFGINFEKNLRKCDANTSYVFQNKSTPKLKLYIHTSDIYI